ncbi:unnamed protein product [Amaranthus hypochondriacus]
MAKLLPLLLFIVFSFINVEYVSSWGFFKATYHVTVGNGLNDTLLVHCKSGDSDLKLQNLAVNANFSWQFKAGWSVFVQRLYFCGLTWDHHGRKVFDAFVDDQQFVDTKCGGRHCYWKAFNDGIYLYNQYKSMFRKMYTWDKYLNI